MKRLALVILISPVLCHGAGLSVAGSGASSYSILVSPDAPVSVREAADELQRCVQVATRIHLPVVEELPGHGKCMVIGAHPEVPVPLPRDLKRDGYIMRTVDGHLVLAGRDERIHPAGKAPPHAVTENDPLGFYTLKRWRASLEAGSYNAVIGFLRDYLGVRWFMPGRLGENIPARQAIIVPDDLDRRVEPAFGLRRFAFTDFDERALRAYKKGDNPDFDFRRLEESTRWGRRLRHASSPVLANGHSWRQWIPADQVSSPWIADAIGLPGQGYGQAHRAWFALRGGERQNRYTSTSQHGGQLCVSNADMQQQYIDNLLAYKEAAPNTRMFGLGQNDGGNHCECGDCRAWDVSPAGQGGDVESRFLTDRMLRFQNSVARAVLDRHPDVRFTITAYHSTGHPPLREQVHPAMDVHGYYNYLPYRFHIPHKRSELEEALAGWGKATPNFYFGTFYFAYGNYSFPWSTTETIKWTINLMRRHGMAGFDVYFDADPMRPVVGQLGPDPWVLSQLLWNPEANADGLADEWYQGSFGPDIAPIVRAYFDTIAAAMAAEIPRHGDFWARRGFSQRQINLNVYPAIRAPCGELVRKAVGLAEEQDERVRWRVDQIARCWNHVERTFDAREAFRHAARSADETDFLQALEAGRARQALMVAPASRYAISPEAAAVSDTKASMGVLSEAPKVERPQATAPRATRSPNLLAETIDPIWNGEGALIGRKKPARFLNNKTFMPPIDKAHTEARILSTGEGLGIMVWASEPRMDDLKPVNDASRVWRGDVIEIFIAPSGGSDEFFQFLVNPDNTALALAYRGDTGIDSAYQPRWQHNARRFKQGWVAEFSIPWKALGIETPPGAGAIWGFNICRSRHAGARENSAWSPTGGAFAQPAKFGTLLFR